MNTVTTAALQISGMCPDWCDVRSAGAHPVHGGTVADWEGPGPLLVEVSLVQRGDQPAEVHVDEEEWGPDGETVAERRIIMTPAEALAAAGHPSSSDRLAAALVAAARLAGVEEVRA